MNWQIERTYRERRHVKPKMVRSVPILPVVIRPARLRPDNYAIGYEIKVSSLFY